MGNAFMYRESEQYFDIVNEYDEVDMLYDILKKGATLETDCPEFARECRKMFPNSTIILTPRIPMLKHK